MILTSSIVQSPRGNIVRIWNSSGALKKVEEVYENQIFPGQAKGVNLHKEATLQLVLLEGRLQIRIYEGSRTSIVDLDNEFQSFVILPETWFSLHNNHGSLARVLVLSSAPHSPEDLCKKDFPTKANS